ncbi:MAG TPA: hypothetical protein PKD54_16060, partial [Pirellulaceae bacterium]|nr:hypothetical protein [Pirellulaceae bacterium]
MNARIQLFILFAILLSGTPAIAQPPTDRVAPADSISDDDLISVVFLLKNRYRISQRQLAAKVEKAWSVTLGTENDATDFVVGRGDQFIISVDEKFFIVHVINQRYIDSLPENTRLLLDRDVQRLIEEHRAWISVDLLS